MTDHSVESLFREIDEELRQDKAKLFWDRFGNYVIGAAMLVVISVAGFQGWKAYDQKVRVELSSQYAQAQAEARNQDFDKSMAAFSKIAGENAGGYGLLSKFQAAALLREKGDIEGAAKAYFAIADDNSAEPLFRDLASLLGSMANLDQDIKGVISRLESINRDDAPFRYSVREILALAYLKEGNADKARDNLDKLINDNAVPATLKARAQELLDVLNG